MGDLKNALITACIIVLLAVAYASFWILVILFVAFIIYQVVSVFNEG